MSSTEFLEASGSSSLNGEDISYFVGLVRGLTKIRQINHHALGM